jgi:hypothetical protein
MRQNVKLDPFNINTISYVLRKVTVKRNKTYVEILGVTDTYVQDTQAFMAHEMLCPVHSPLQFSCVLYFVREYTHTLTLYSF